MIMPSSPSRPSIDCGEPATRVHIRWLIRRDMPEVLAIEAAGFDRPWGEVEMLEVLRGRHCIGMVAEAGDRVVGFMIYEIYKSHLQVLDFAVDPASRRRGVGRQMVAKLISKLSGHRRTRVDLLVRESNLPGLVFFRGRGFLAVGVEREHYPDTGEDAILMRREVDREDWTS